MATTTTIEHSQPEDWMKNLATVGSVKPPPKTHENASFMRDKYAPVQLSVGDYRTLHETGFLKLEHLIPASEVQDMSKHMDAVLAGTETAPGFPTVMESMSKAERIAAFNRIHDAHRVHALHERFLLHPRILDVLEQLTGPDVLALQSMTFFKQPGEPGQGYHQDSYYIPTLPNSLIAAWVAVSEATEENGCLWFCVGSQNEPLYPHPENEYTHASRGLDGVFDNTTASDDAVDTNQLAKVAERYPEIPCPALPGDVIFFHGNILHRSHANASTAPRRAFAGHYCDARSFVPWNMGERWEGMESGKEANGCHILARGDSHLPFSGARFGMPCAADQERRSRLVGSQVKMPLGRDGEMGMQDLNVMMRDDD